MSQLKVIERISKDFNVQKSNNYVQKTGSIWTLNEVSNNV